MNPHEPSDQLSAYADGELPAGELAAVEAHLGACPPCREALAGLREVKSALAAAPTRPMPPALIAALEADHARRLEAAPRFAWLWPRLWIPAGALAGALALATLWVGLSSRLASEDELPLEPLVAAHSRYAAETLVPQSVPAASNGYLQLAYFRPDEP